MISSRNYIIDRVTSRTVTKEEFDFDKLQAPPLNYFLSPMDIAELYSIAKSLRYSGKPQERYAAIDAVCKRRGLIRFAGGTNRVVYSHPEFPDYLIKIASDAVGLGDNPAEFKNQYLLKPFVAKMFEVSNCGTVALVERVNPITTREEYLSVADDVFELINEWLIGEYVLADIGSHFFCNMAVRSGFGVVLIDYPYLYKLDGDKLYCNKPDPLSPSGCCDGVIDYDDGYNKLVCTKCGATYKAKELELKNESGEFLVTKKGERKKMVIKKSGGSKPEYSNVTINTENRDITFKDIENALPRRGLVKVKTTTVTPNEEVKKEEKVEKHLTKLDLPVANTEDNKKSVNGVNTNPQVKSVLTTPIQISEEIKAEAIAESEKEVKVSRDSVEDMIEKLIKDINTIDFDDIKVELCAKIIDKLGDVLDTKDLGNLMIAKLAEDSKELSEYPEFTRSEDMEEFIANTFICDVVFSGATITEKGDVDVSYGCTIYDKHDTEQVTVYDGLEERISEADVTNKLPAKEVIKEVEKVVEVPVEVEKVVEVPVEAPAAPAEAEEENDIRQIKLYNGIHMNISEIVPDISRDEDYEVYIPVDEEGEYLVVDHSLVGIGTLDDRDIDQIQVVSKEWFKEVSKEHEEELAATEPTEEVEEEETEEEVDYSEAVPENGMSVEEFLEAEAAAEESSEEEVEEQE